MSTLYPIYRRRSTYPMTNTYKTNSDLLSLFGDFFESYDSKSHKELSMPKANIVRTDDGYRIELAAPGLSREDFEMAVDDRTLTIRVGTEDCEEYEKNVIHREYRFETFTRVFSLPKGANIGQIIARYEAGILVVDVPMVAEVNKKRTITVD